MELKEMAIEKQYLSDFEAVLSHRYDNGADYWTTPDRRLIKGSPFSTLDSVLYLLELGMEPNETLIKECTDLIFSAWREDGSFKLYPQGSIYPCHTAHATDVLCHMGYVFHARLQKTFKHLITTTIYLFTFMFCPFTIVQRRTTDFWKP